jgi:hypothetical protein
MASGLDKLTVRVKYRLPGAGCAVMAANVRYSPFAIEQRAFKTGAMGQ